MEKIEVNGDNAHPIFVYLRQHTHELKSKRDVNIILNIPWNFCKWVVDPKGRVLKYINPSAPVDSYWGFIDSLLDDSD